MSSNCQIIEFGQTRKKSPGPKTEELQNYAAEIRGNNQLNGQIVLNIPPNRYLNQSTPKILA